MDKIFLLFFCIVFSVALRGQNISPEQVPAKVVKAFTDSYPAAIATKWEKKKDLFKAGFKIDKTDHDIWYDADGKIAKHRTEIKKSELPSAVTKAIQSGYEGYSIGDCEKTDEKGILTYKVKLKKAEDKKTLHFAADGSVLKKEKENKDS